MKKLNGLEMRTIDAGDYTINYDYFDGLGKCLTLELERFGTFFVNFVKAENTEKIFYLVKSFGFKPWNAKEGTYSFYVSIYEHLEKISNFFHPDK